MMIFRVRLLIGAPFVVRTALTKARHFLGVDLGRSDYGAQLPLKNVTAPSKMWAPLCWKLLCDSVG